MLCSTLRHQIMAMPALRLLTVADLDALPDDGNRYDLKADAATLQSELKRDIAEARMATGR